MKNVYFIFCIIFLTTCSPIKPAPVVYKITPILNEVLNKENLTDNRLIKPLIKPSKNIFIVKKGDTLQKISKELNIKVGDLLKINKLKDPNKIFIGQNLIIPFVKGNTEDLKKDKNIKFEKNNFIWPVKGKLINKFGKNKNGIINDGINISTKKGEPIVATENGEVIYVGRNVRGFGNLLMIRHFDGWISAYAHNNKIFVKKGESVIRGQKISTIGSTGLVKKPQLHFELRKGIKPINPIKLLPPLA